MILSRYERMIAICFRARARASSSWSPASASVAVMLGVAALIIVMSVMNGFRAELFDKIVGLNGHAVVQGYDGRSRTGGDCGRRAPHPASPRRCR
jgi:lipoprotein-releasing system permease protein